ncbi:P-loop NTPase family protein [Sabulicella rubraurantiaca]|uniref:chromosomal replication initiator DnaA n=1 Tax=Sabulicella rubraurantiaca TaxID=2811429 RepID=UPI001A96AE27|nr:chromosomal replication initiator DnaA [Sabulicella rubraurantiaca]
MSQLVLPIFPPAEFREEEFIADASNEAALRWLEAPERWPNRRLVLAGPLGTGKTHLLHIMAARNGWELRDGPALRGLPPAPRRGVALDDSDMPGEEAALFHLVNACAEAGHPLLMAAPRPPAAWPVRLPDLRSRLAASGLATVEEPSDTLLEALFRKQLAERQLQLDPAVLAAVRLRLPRSAAAVAEAAARLDRASLAAGRLTRPIALAAIEPLAADDDPETAGSDPVRQGPALL